jgi:hypothetical protein
MAEISLLHPRFDLAAVERIDCEYHPAPHREALRSRGWVRRLTVALAASVECFDTLATASSGLVVVAGPHHSTLAGASIAAQALMVARTMVVVALYSPSALLQVRISGLGRLQCLY